MDLAGAQVEPPRYKWIHQVQDQELTIRTLVPEDDAIEAAFVRNLSDESRYFRFHGTLKELTPQMLNMFTHLEFPLQMALSATVIVDRVEIQIGVARYATPSISESAEIAIVVADEYQHRGIATLLLTHLRAVAIEAGIVDLKASVLSDNFRMLSLARSLGFKTQSGSTDHRVRDLGKSIKQSPDTT